MKFPWTKNTTSQTKPLTPPAPAPVAEPVREEPPTPAPAFEPEQEQFQEPEPVPASVPASRGPVAAWPWLTPTRIMIAAASVPSLLSLIWLATTVMEIFAGPTGEPTLGGLATGVFADVLIVSTVLVGWFMPSVRSQASVGGWIGAVAASGLLTYHYWGSEQVFFAAVPLAAKFLWHLALTARTALEQEWARQAAEKAKAAKAEADRLAQDKAEAEAADAAEAGADDASLTVEQRRIIADLEREAEFTKLQADAKATKAEAKIYAEQRVDMATDRAEADRLKARYEMAAEVGGRLPIQVLAQFLPDLPGVSTEVTEIHRDRSQIGAAPAANGAAEAIPAGFGAALTEARNGIGGIGVDLGEHNTPQGGNGIGGTGGTARPQAHHAARRASGQATRDRVLAAIEKHGRAISTNELAEKLGLGRTTVRDHRKALAKEGKKVHPDQK